MKNQTKFTIMEAGIGAQFMKNGALTGDVFISKHSGFAELNNLLKSEGGLSSGIIENLLSQIVENKNLPVYTQGEKLLSDDTEEEALEKMKKDLQSFRLRKQLEEADPEDMPIYQACPGCGKHGELYFGKIQDDENNSTVESFKVFSKKQAAAFLEELVAEKKITQEASDRVLKEIVAEENLPSENPDLFEDELLKNMFGNGVMVGVAFRH